MRSQNQDKQETSASLRKLISYKSLFKFILWKCLWIIFELEQGKFLKDSRDYRLKI